ncbi:hypothetical protein BCR33DRAFT_850823 [Rhizoclosmatium globosum]|uniref:Transcription factor domain-containing protein n=1 Tax=Rhizoclosmatium globosum TaxID=329046 RepID=A0A1Y2CBA5_9FUNG|nr:hypothetical protein BCR33DRAFT_850823 [Rhizoclosmatium globosum]|eukprot:ORY44216.1 hypothetical protein BCR33DRAFT_850823 [Rhizoclosmatium globosum]
MHSPPLNQSLSHDLLHITTGPAITQIIHAMEAPLLDTHHEDWYIEDPDLMPTMEDFDCVLAFVRHNSLVSTLKFSMDVHGFMMTFFTQPAPLRLVICAIASYFSGTISDEAALCFFKRARKAVILAADKPSLATVKAYYWIFVYSKVMKKGHLGLPFLIMAVNMVPLLKLDVDPDEQPHLGLNEIEKEERRRITWGLGFISHHEMSLNLPDCGIQVLLSHQVKPLRAIEGVFGSISSFESLCEVRKFMVAIKRYYANGPSSLQEIISSPSLVNMQLQSELLRSKVPSYMLLPLDSPSDMASILLKDIDPTDVFVLEVNLDHLVCTTLVYRSHLYLSGLKRFRPSQCTLSMYGTIMWAIKQSCSALENTAHIIKLLIEMPNHIHIQEWRDVAQVKVNLILDIAELLTGFVLKLMAERDISEPVGPVMEAMLREIRNSINDYNNEVGAGTVNCMDLNKTDFSQGEYQAYLGLLGLELADGGQPPDTPSSWPDRKFPPLLDVMDVRPITSVK